MALKWAHNLTYHRRQVNHHYLPNPGDLLMIDSGKKYTLKMLKKSVIQVREKQQQSDIVFLQSVLFEIIDWMVRVSWCLCLNERRGRCV